MACKKKHGVTQINFIKMNNIKKTGLGLLVAALAFGFSAFTNRKATNKYRYYRTNLSFPANDYRGYTYYAGDHCAPSGDFCSAMWDVGSTVPAEGSTPPSGGSYEGGIAEGHFDY